MADGSLTFIIPVRDPQGVANWKEVRHLISATLASLAQVSGDTRILVVASKGTELPKLPSIAQLIEVDIPYRPLPPTEGPQRHDAVRADKGLRVLAALTAVRPQGHVMVVDYDDYVSRRLGDLVASNPEATGWLVEKGLMYDGGPVVYTLPRGFHRTCGTSIIVRADLLPIGEQPSDVHMETVKRTLGSHRFLPADLEQKGTPLTPVPFIGAVYRVGNRDSTSPSATIPEKVLPRNAIRRPHHLVRYLSRLRPTLFYRKEFLLP